MFGTFSLPICNISLPYVHKISIVSNQAAKGDNGPAYLLPAAGLFQILLGYVIGKVISLFMYGSAPEKVSESKQFLIGTTFGNSGPLPLVFTDALFRTAPDATLLPRSVAFISLYLLGWSPLFWVIGNAIFDISGQLISYQIMLYSIFIIL